jgi:hypothetical protein
MNLVSKSEFARRCNVSKQRVSQWLASGHISGDAIVGTGRYAKLDADLALAQVSARTSAEQLGVNGLDTRLGTGSDDTGELLKLERLTQARLKTARMQAEEKELHGHWMVASEVVGGMNRLAAELIGSFERFILQDLPGVVAGELGVDRKGLTILIRREWLAWRSAEVERREAAAAKVPVKSRQVS